MLFPSAVSNANKMVKTSQIFMVQTVAFALCKYFEEANEVSIGSQVLLYSVSRFIPVVHKTGVVLTTSVTGASHFLESAKVKQSNRL